MENGDYSGGLWPFFGYAPPVVSDRKAEQQRERDRPGLIHCREDSKRMRNNFKAYLLLFVFVFLPLKFVFPYPRFSRFQ